MHYTRSYPRYASPENDEYGVTEVDAVFIPPWFISNTMMRAHIGYSCSPTYSPPEPAYSLHPISINQDPELWQALDTYDVPKLKRLFLTGRGRPTDMILTRGSEHAVTLLEVRSNIVIC